MQRCKSHVFEMLQTTFPEKKIKEKNGVIYTKDLFAIAFMRFRHDRSNKFYVEILQSTGSRLFLDYSPPNPTYDLTCNLPLEEFSRYIVSRIIEVPKYNDGDLKFISKEKARTAANLWANYLSPVELFRNPERISRFKKIFAKRLSVTFQIPHGVRINVDYSPCRLLRQAWELSDPQDETDVFGIFPFKTETIIYEDRIIVDGGDLKLEFCF